MTEGVYEVGSVHYMHAYLMVDNPYTVTFSYYGTFTQVICGLVWLQEQIPKRHVFKRLDCELYDNHYGLNNEHKGGGAIWPFNEHENIHASSKNHEESGFNLDWIC